jgi:thiamine biosynthesis protein ThiS
MKLFINGDERDCDAQSVADLVNVLGLPGPTLLIEHNGTAQRREEWPAARLAESDRLEILRIAAGG